LKILSEETMNSTRKRILQFEEMPSSKDLTQKIAGALRMAGGLS
jgi:hypothetical protein